MDDSDNRVGTTLGKYRVHELIGRGGMGVVYRAEHVYIGKEVAIKVLHHTFGTRDDAVKRFLREARAASLINHPNIVDVTDFGKTNDGTVFFAMELLRGQPLDCVIARTGRLDLLRAIGIMTQLAGALGAAHAKGIIHRDLKPENIMLLRREGHRELLREVRDPSGAVRTVSENEREYDFVKILDFGVAKVMEPEGASRSTQAGMIFGTPEYMAPETARVGTADPRSDIYALGVIFYEMLTGTVPFQGDSPIDVMLKHVAAEVEPPRKRAPNAEITQQAEAVILRAMAKEPEARYQTMEELSRDLQSCFGAVRYRRSVPGQGSAIPLTRILRKPPSEPLSADPMTQALDARNPIAEAHSVPLQAQVGAPVVVLHHPPQQAPIPLTKKKAVVRSVPSPTPPHSMSVEGAGAPHPTPPVAASSNADRPRTEPSVEERRRATLPLGSRLLRFPEPPSPSAPSPELPFPNGPVAGVPSEEIDNADTEKMDV